MIRMGRLLPGAMPIGIGISGARRGVVRISPDEDVTTIVKPGSFGEIAAELFVAMLAREIALPVPEPVLVYDPEGSAFLCGSIDIELPNLCTAFPLMNPNNVDDLNLLIAKIKDWSDHPLAAAFDEWIANVDRNIKNLLWDGAGFVLIDHAQSMQQNTPGIPDANKIVLALLTVITDDVGRRRLLKQITKNGLTFDDIYIENAANHLGSVGVTMIAGYSIEFDNFLKNRLPIIEQLIRARFPMGQQLLIQSI